MIEIENIITRYIEAESTDYAILLNGPWGCGKTYYLKNTLFSVIANIEKSSTIKYKPIYISLNGLSATEDISNQILFSCLGLSQAVSGSFGIIKSIIEFGNSAPLPIINIIASAFKNLGSTIKKTATKGIDLSSKVLCFDDLERFDSDKLSLENILGYINTNYLEHNHIKIIFICNEGELIDKCVQYKKIKEKVIGRVVNFQQDLKTTITNLLRNRYKSKTEYTQFLEYHKELIFDILRQNQITNLRTIGFALDSLETIHGYCDSPKAKAHMKRLIIFILLISFEYKDSFLMPADYNNIKDLDEIETKYRIYYGLKDYKSEEQPPYNVVFYEKYLKDRDITFTFYKSVYVYLLTGYMTKQGLEEDISGLDSRKITDWDSAYSKFLDYKRLEQDELSDTIRVVLNFAKEGKYILKEYLSIYSNIKAIIDRDYLENRFDGFFVQLHSGLIRALENISEGAIRHHDRRIWNEYDKHSDPQFKELLDTIKNYLDALNSKHGDDIMKEFISSFDNKDNIVFEYLDKIGMRHLFERFNNDGNIEMLLSLSNRGIYNLEAILYLNYTQISNAGDLYFDDVPHIRMVADRIEKDLPSRGYDKMRVARFSELISSMRESALHLEKTKKSGG